MRPPYLCDSESGRNLRVAIPAEIADSAFAEGGHGLITVGQYDPENEGAAAFVEGPLYPVKWGDLRFAVWRFAPHKWAYLAWCQSYKNEEPIELPGHHGSAEAAITKILWEAAEADGMTRKEADPLIEKEIQRAIALT